MLDHKPVTGRAIDSDDFEAELEAAIRGSASMPPLHIPARPRPLTFPERLAAAQAARLCKVATKPEAAKAPKTLTGKGVEADRARDCVVRFSPRPSKPSHTPFSLPSHPTSALTSNPSSLPVSSKLKPSPRKSWTRSKIPARDRFGYGVDVAARNGGRAFSLNLSVARERAILRSADPKRTLSTYINRALKKHLGRAIPYSFAFEFSPEGRLHVHGAYIPVDQSEAHAQAVQAAFREAGGKIKSRAGSRQMNAKDIYDASGWFRYTIKTYRRTVERLGADKVTFMSKELRKLAIDQYNTTVTPVERKAKLLTTDLSTSERSEAVVKLFDMPKETTHKESSKPQEKTPMSLEFYVPAERYSLLVRQITVALRRKTSTAQEREIGVAVALMGEERIWPQDGDPKFELAGASFTVPFHHDLHMALLALEPDPVSGFYEIDQVKLTLGEIGDIWPDHIREDAQAA